MISELMSVCGVSRLDRLRHVSNSIDPQIHILHSQCPLRDSTFLSDADKSIIELFSNRIRNLLEPRRPRRTLFYFSQNDRSHR